MNKGHIIQNISPAGLSIPQVLLTLMERGQIEIFVVPWKNGHTLVCNATYPDMFAPSHMALAAREAGLVAI